MTIVKRLTFATYQAFFFLIEVLRGKAKLSPQFLNTGWPGSPWRSRFFLIGFFTVAEEQLFVKVENDIYPLASCPQKEFFRTMSLGQDLTNDYYYSMVRTGLDEEGLSYWLEKKIELRSSYEKQPWLFTAVIVRVSKNRFVVEDGAHRLALSNLSGERSYRVGVSLWNFNSG